MYFIGMPVDTFKKEKLFIEFPCHRNVLIPFKWPKGHNLGISAVQNIRN